MMEWYPSKQLVCATGEACLMAFIRLAWLSASHNFSYAIDAVTKCRQPLVLNKAEKLKGIAILISLPSCFLQKNLPRVYCLLKHRFYCLCEHIHVEVDFKPKSQSSLWYFIRFVSQTFGVITAPWAHLLNTLLGRSRCLFMMWLRKALNLAHITAPCFSLVSSSVDVTDQ